MSPQKKRLERTVRAMKGSASKHNDRGTSIASYMIATKASASHTSRKLPEGFIIQPWDGVSWNWLQRDPWLASVSTVPVRLVTAWAPGHHAPCQPDTSSRAPHSTAQRPACLADATGSSPLVLRPWSVVPVSCLRAPKASTGVSTTSGGADRGRPAGSPAGSGSRDEGDWSWRKGLVGGRSAGASASSFSAAMLNPATSPRPPAKAPHARSISASPGHPRPADSSRRRLPAKWPRAPPSCCLDASTLDDSGSPLSSRSSWSARPTSCACRS
mmetsp:Transcript_58727/g.166923  ORF Transcript_58727/g.166923 Transcript_58727/m.166923 type:complete len:271 (-) Transcript_58727:172-984(-)